MHSVVGHCPKCGAPLYAPTTYGSICPPPSQPSCSCALVGYQPSPTYERGNYTFTPNPLSADDIRKIVREEIERAGMGKAADEVKHG